ncbi:nucleotidyltransferase domain-containing protein [Arthrobacter sp. H5]|uniref:nucleotidyltransferase family protein n=1 Tax=Arthrobacter sp. H5 TaxID=1267973 RepID=UPI0012DC7C5E|nr:nucleotidyltransferase domain-containing protein [Arthrobacter sp. H5]
MSFATSSPGAQTPNTPQASWGLFSPGKRSWESIPSPRTIGPFSHGRTADVFGSVARGEDVSARDLDLFVNFDHNADVFDLADLVTSLEELTGMRVDVISEGDAMAWSIRGAVAAWWRSLRLGCCGCAWT